jgi:hypothetical protein
MLLSLTTLKMLILSSESENGGCLYTEVWDVNSRRFLRLHLKLPKLKSTTRFIKGIHKRMVRFQKRIKNVCLTLHGHNIHRQRRQLSKFLMRYQQFASHAYCVECTSASQSRSSSALDRTCCCKWRQETYPLATPFARSYTVWFLSMGVR